MIQNKDEMMRLVKENGMTLRLASSELQDDRELVHTAVENNPYSLQFASEILQQDKELLSMVDKNHAYYFSMVDPATGLKYNIPMLDTMSPTYFYDYVYYMKIKERTPDTFENILRWN